MEHSETAKEQEQTDGIDQAIVDATLSLFSDSDAPLESVTIDQICARASIDSAAFLDRFHGAGQVLSVCYLSLLDDAEHESRAIPGFELLALEERLASFVFVLLDVFERNRRFVEATFHGRAAGLLSPFRQQLQNLVSELMVATDVSSANRYLFDHAPIRFALGASISNAIAEWIRDDSEGRERSIALIDRLLAWWSEFLTTRLPDRSIDLLRYSVEAGYLPIDRVPFVRDWFRK